MKRWLDQNPTQLNGWGLALFVGISLTFWGQCAREARSENTAIGNAAMGHIRRIVALGPRPVRLNGSQDNAVLYRETIGGCWVVGRARSFHYNDSKWAGPNVQHYCPSPRV